MPCGPLCVFTPVVVDVAWPVLSSAIASTMANLGYEVVAAQTEAAQAARRSVELDVRGSQGFEETLGEAEELVVQKGAVTLSFRKGGDGRLKIRASGASVSEEELRAAGTQALNGFMQAYVHEKVASELKKRGFSMQETKLPDGSIRLLAKKWG